VDTMTEGIRVYDFHTLRDDFIFVPDRFSSRRGNVRLSRKGSDRSSTGPVLRWWRNEVSYLEQALVEGISDAARTEPCRARFSPYQSAQPIRLARHADWCEVNP